MYMMTEKLSMCCVCCCVQQRLPEDATIRELAPEFRPPEWLTDVVTRTTPYFPQMGDEVIYFVQGHQQYVEVVKSSGVYRIDTERNQPWHKMPHIRVCLNIFVSRSAFVYLACFSRVTQTQKVLETEIFLDC